MLKRLNHYFKKTFVKQNSQKKQKRDHVLIESPFIEQHLSYMPESEKYRHSSDDIAYSDGSSLFDSQTPSPTVALTHLQEKAQKHAISCCRFDERASDEDFQESWKPLAQFYLQLSEAEKEDYCCEEIAHLWFQNPQSHQDILALFDILNNSNLALKVVTHNFIFALFAGFPSQSLAHLLHHLTLSQKQHLIEPYWADLQQKPMLLPSINNMLWAITQCHQSHIIGPELFENLLNKTENELLSLSKALNLIRSYHPTALDQELLDHLLHHPEHAFCYAQEFLQKTIPALLAPWDDLHPLSTHSVKKIFSHYRSIFTKERGGAVILAEKLSPLVKLLSENPSYIGIAAVLAYDNDDETSSLSSDDSTCLSKTTLMREQIKNMMRVCQKEADPCRIGYWHLDLAQWDKLSQEYADEALQDTAVLMLLRSDPELWPEPGATEYLNNQLAESIVFLRLLSCCLLIATKKTLSQQFEVASILYLLGLTGQVIERAYHDLSFLEQVVIQEGLLAHAIKRLGTTHGFFQELEMIFPFQNEPTIEIEEKITLNLVKVFEKTSSQEIAYHLASDNFILYWAISIAPEHIEKEGCQTVLEKFARQQLDNLLVTMGPQSQPLLLTQSKQQTDSHRYPRPEYY